MSKRLKHYGYEVYSSELIDRGYGDVGVDFLTITKTWDGDIVTNPPYKYAVEFVKKSLEIVNTGNHIVMFLRLQFLEGKAGKKLFEINPPKYVLVSSSRILCAKNADFDGMIAGGGSAIAYAWYVWEKGYTGDTILKWIN